jgi:hypothetical protein
MGSLIQSLPHFKSGKLTPLGTTGLKRAAATPDIPTIAESGVPGYEANNIWLLAAPSGHAREYHRQVERGDGAVPRPAGNGETLRGGRCRARPALARGRAQAHTLRNGEVGEGGEDRQYTDSVNGGLDTADRFT